MPAKVQNTSVTAPRQQKNDVRPSGGINPIRRYSVTNRLSRISFMFFRILMRYVITLDIPIQMIQVGQQWHFYKRFYVLKMVANFGDFFLLHVSLCRVPFLGITNWFPVPSLLPILLASYLRREYGNCIRHFPLQVAVRKALVVRCVGIRGKGRKFGKCL